MLEIHVDVGRLVALLRDEPLDEHRHACRVDLGDTETVTDGRVGGRAAPLAQDPAPAREAHDVVHGQEIRLVSQVRDQLEFMLQQLFDVRRRAVRPAFVLADLDQSSQVARGSVTLRNQLARILVAQLVEREVDSCGDIERGLQQFGRIELGERIQPAQVPLAVRLQAIADPVDRCPQADRGQRVAQSAPAADVHVHVAGRHQR